MEAKFRNNSHGKRKETTINNYCYKAKKEYKLFVKQGFNKSIDNPDTGIKKISEKQKLQKQEINTITIPIPIRENGIVVVSQLPVDLKESEAKKISNTIIALSQKC